MKASMAVRRREEEGAKSHAGGKRGMDKDGRRPSAKTQRQHWRLVNVPGPRPSERARAGREGGATLERGYGVRVTRGRRRAREGSSALELRSMAKMSPASWCVLPGCSDGRSAECDGRLRGKERRRRLEGQILSVSFTRPLAATRSNE
jgi:hypothetical protein